MSRLQEEFPPRSVDPLDRATGYVARRSGMVEPADITTVLREDARQPDTPPPYDELLFSAAFSPGSVPGLDTAAVTITAPGTVEGDFIDASYDPMPVAIGWIIFAYCHTPDEIRFNAFNCSAGARSLGSGTAYCRIRR